MVLSVPSTETARWQPFMRLQAQDYFSAFSMDALVPADANRAGLWHQSKDHTAVHIYDGDGQRYTASINCLEEAGMRLPHRAGQYLEIAGFRHLATSK